MSWNLDGSFEFYKHSKLRACHHNVAAFPSSRYIADILKSRRFFAVLNTSELRAYHHNGGLCQTTFHQPNKFLMMLLWGRNQRCIGIALCCRQLLLGWQDQDYRSQNLTRLDTNSLSIYKISFFLKHYWQTKHNRVTQDYNKKLGTMQVRGEWSFVQKRD